MRQERAYRRGTVAGLSLGEVFILLSFVLVLAVLLISIDFRRESTPESGEPTDANSITPPDPELIQTLVAERDVARDERDWAVDLVRQLESQISELEEQLRKSNVDVANAIESLKLQDSEIRKLEAELKSTIQQRDSANEDAQRLQDRISAFGEGDQDDDAFANLIDENERLKEALARAEEQIEERVSKSEKGSNPPCWYERVPAEGGSGTREKAIYALDLRVTDSEIMFGNRGLPSGEAEGSDNRIRSFAAEAEMLGLPSMPYGVWLTHAEASSELKKLADAGNASDVRIYPCKFFAKVWDQTGTGPESKENWRRIKENVIERFVLIYVVKDDPWPH